MVEKSKLFAACLRYLLQTMAINKSAIRNLYIHALVWLSIILVTYTLLIGFMPASHAVARALLMGVMTAVVHYSNAYIFYRTVTKGKPEKYFAIVVLWALILSLARTLLERYVFPPQILPIYFQANPARPLLFVVSTFIAFLVSYIVLYSTYLSQKEKTLLQAINNHNEARLRYLQSHINPHFLFNALNNVYSLVITRSDKAPETLLMLTDLLRYSVYQKDGSKVPVSMEAEQIDMLIKLFTLRRDEPYKITFTHERVSGSIEPMILVPLAENCLKHCDFDLNENAYTVMSLYSDDNELRFDAENTFTPKNEKDTYGGVGLENMKERLELIYGDNAKFEIKQADNIFKVQLRLQWKQ